MSLESSTQTPSSQVSEEPKQNYGRGLVDRKLVEPPPSPPPPKKKKRGLIAGCLYAALQLWFFGGFRCGVLLFLLDTKVENR